MLYSEIAQSEVNSLASDYRRLGIKSWLSNSELERVEHILKVCESNDELNRLIIEIDIELGESQCSIGEFKEYCSKVREDTRKHMAEYFKQESYSVTNHL